MGTLTVDNLNTSTIIGSGAPLITSSTPAFFARKSTVSSITNNSRNKVECQTEVFDSAGQYDNSTNYRFTPQTTGKYNVYAQSQLISEGQGTDQWMLHEIFKNGTSSGFRISSYIDFRNTNGNGGGPLCAGIFDMNGTDDYVEFYCYPGLSSGTPSIGNTGNNMDTFFGAFRIG